MRLRASLSLPICCCAALAGCAVLAGCAASGPKGPDLSVTRPKVGRPAPPASAQAALSQEAFSPYAALSLADNDGLAPGQSIFALGQACMAAQGYPDVNAGVVPIGITLGGTTALAFTQPWGGWGYLGDVMARQSGFRPQPGTALSQLGVDFQPTGPASLTAAEQTAAGKCGTIVGNFTQAARDGALAGIGTLADDISNDVQHDPAVQRATQSWGTCMAGNGYHFGQPAQVFFAERQAMYGGQQTISIGAPISAAAQRAQLSVAVADAGCTDHADLAGIYFAVQASYERQLVSANAQALTAGVRRYRALYARTLRRLPDLLRTAKALPFTSPSGKAG